MDSAANLGELLKLNCPPASSAELAASLAGGAGCPRHAVQDAPAGSETPRQQQQQQQQQLCAGVAVRPLQTSFSPAANKCSCSHCGYCLSIGTLPSLDALCGASDLGSMSITRLLYCRDSTRDTACSSSDTRDGGAEGGDAANADPGAAGSAAQPWSPGSEGDSEGDDCTPVEDLDGGVVPLDVMTASASNEPYISQAQWSRDIVRATTYSQPQPPRQAPGVKAPQPCGVSGSAGVAGATGATHGTLLQRLLLGCLGRPPAAVPAQGRR
ncbi:hypothetical protein PLESTB_001451100 [Pleodorina starrii]|uniref:Uncharacterized protein n=1 Tax=Pleodorina starrii TaxID=330485 RepID=A0A9W6BV96_9CHLO|nr:hypothetical protein PLESTB_001451100 [Pleodorina starrii]